MKTNKKWAHQRGTTLIELSVVIAVILLLVGVLFIGIGAWRDGANKAACIVNLASIQKAVRGYQNINTLNAGATVAITDLVTAGYFGAAPACPGGGTYTVTGTIPVPGTPYAACSLATTNKHVPSSTANW